MYTKIDDYVQAAFDLEYLKRVMLEIYEDERLSDEEKKSLIGDMLICAWLLLIRILGPQRACELFDKFRDVLLRSRRTK